MKAILTKYLPPTDTKGSRVKAYDADGNSVTVNWDYSGNDSKTHIDACEALIKKLDWFCTILGHGYIKNGRCFVLTHKESLNTKKY